MLFNYTCRGKYHTFGRIAWSIPFASSNEVGSLVFGRMINRVSRSNGSAWCVVFNGCESTIWRDFSFFKDSFDLGWANETV